MAESAVTQTGVAEMRAAIEQLSPATTLALKRVAQGTANAVLVTSRQTLLAAQKTDVTALAEAIEVIEDLPNQMYRVVSKPPRGEAAGVTIWNEHGTVKMAPRGYMLTGAKTHEARYHDDCETAVNAAARGLLG